MVAYRSTNSRNLVRWVSSNSGKLESGKVGEWESGRLGEWESGREKLEIINLMLPRKRFLMIMHIETSKHILPMLTLKSERRLSHLAIEILTDDGVFLDKHFVLFFGPLETNFALLNVSLRPTLSLQPF